MSFDVIKDTIPFDILQVICILFASFLQKS